MSDRFVNNQPGLEAPATRHYAISPANSNLAVRPRCLLVTVAGDVVVQDEAGTNITYPAVPAYTYLLIRAVQVRTSTTATVVGLD
jgi:hypothetical protein